MSFGTARRAVGSVTNGWRRVTDAATRARVWSEVLATAFAAAAVAGAGQLGVAYGTGLLHPPFVDEGATFSGGQWAQQLTWVAWIAALAVLGGGLGGAWRARRRRRPFTLGNRINVGVLAGLGAAVVLPLAAVPARDTVLTGPGTAQPALEVVLAAGLGLVVGVLATVAALSARLVAVTLTLLVPVVWGVALVSVAPSLGAADLPTVRLAVPDLPVLRGAQPAVAVAGPPVLVLLVCGAIALAARSRQLPPLPVAAATAAAPGLLALSYLIGSPAIDGDRVQTPAFAGALIAVAVGLLTSLLVGVVRRAPGEVYDGTGRSDDHDGRPGRHAASDPTPLPDPGSGSDPDPGGEPGAAPFGAPAQTGESDDRGDDPGPAGTAAGTTGDAPAAGWPPPPEPTPPRGGDTTAPDPADPAPASDPAGEDPPGLAPLRDDLSAPAAEPPAGRGPATWFTPRQPDDGDPPAGAAELGAQATPPGPAARPTGRARRLRLPRWPRRSTPHELPPVEVAPVGAVSPGAAPAGEPTAEPAAGPAPSPAGVTLSTTDLTPPVIPAPGDGPAPSDGSPSPGDAPTGKVAAGEVAAGEVAAGDAPTAADQAPAGDAPRTAPADRDVGKGKNRRRRASRRSAPPEPAVEQPDPPESPAADSPSTPARPRDRHEEEHIDWISSLAGAEDEPAPKPDTTSRRRLRRDRRAS